MPGSNRKRYPLPKRFQAALSERAYGNLRQLNEIYGLGNNYLLTVILENLEDVIDQPRLRAAFDAFIGEYGSPKPKA